MYALYWKSTFGAEKPRVSVQISARGKNEHAELSRGFGSFLPLAGTDRRKSNFQP